MSLVKCKECGEQVSSAAPFCPKCGIPNPGVDDTCFVKVGSGSGNTVYIFVDNVSIEEPLEYVHTIKFRVFAGEKKMQARALDSESNVIYSNQLVVTLEAGKEYSFFVDEIIPFMRGVNHPKFQKLELKQR